ncbi:MAG: SDR family NAD(P)-dependent oxidoreductase [Alphaproteobacteria bacterium]|nr:SDR family NAD(P)-dependent oxidoreductase [Alphaproteobacteria bacterium]
MAETQVAVIVGAGPGLGAALARGAVAVGMKAVVASRDASRIAEVASSAGATAITCDATDGTSVDALFEKIRRDLGVPSFVVYNASRRVRGPAAELDRAAVRQAIDITAYGGFLVAQAAIRLMLPAGRGSLLFTGASASVKGYAESATFAMGKFALRGLAQSLARELGPKGLHVAHVIIDGAIGRPGANEAGKLDPDALAAAYLQIHQQPRSTWAHEVDLRPSVEKF